MNLQEAQQFVAQFITGEYAPGDYEAFLGWLKRATIEEINTIVDMHESLHENWVLPGGPSPEWITQMEGKLDRASKVEEGEETGGIVVPMSPMTSAGAARLPRRNFWVAAAAVVILISGGTYIYVRSTGPGSNVDADIVEQANLEAGLTRVFSNPSGGDQKEVILEDGSKIWLNAASTLKCPPKLTGAERLVELSGEAYFEVAGSPSDPFRVLIKDAEVEVLGTGFNIMAYGDEPVSRTTLVEGAVKIKSGNDSVSLRPGQEAQIPYPLPVAGGKINIVSNIDLGNALSWRKGYFEFKNTPLRTIMRTLARAYNVDVQYAPAIPDPGPKMEFVIDKKVSLEASLEQLESSLLNIRFKKDGKTVIVTPS